MSRFPQLARHLAQLGRDATVPPACVLNRKITPTDVAAYPAYFIHGAGRPLASATHCPHRYFLTDSCPNCP